MCAPYESPDTAHLKQVVSLRQKNLSIGKIGYMLLRKCVVVVFIVTAAFDCSHAQTSPHQATPHEQAITAASAKSPRVENQEQFNSVRNIHGLAGPFAVAGYRIGVRAIRDLSLLRGSFGMMISHEAPPQVQWSCVVDGLQAATGASLGKLNLELKQVADDDAVRSVVTDRETGAALEFRFADNFLKRFYNVPVADLETAGRLVLTMKDDEIFTVKVLSEGKRKNPFGKK